MNKYLQPNISLRVTFFALSLVFVLFINGAIPFVSMPTLGQAFWTIGFSQSLANQTIIDLYAINFGIPKPAAIAFGLSGAYPASLFIRLGLEPADAYTLMVDLWLTVAFLAAYKIARSFNLSSITSSLASILWLSMPVIWNHAGYSMLSLGIGLLSFYFWAALRLFRYSAHENRLVQIGLCYLSAAIIAVFMDGYSFMMFAIGSSILAAYILLCFPEHRRVQLTFGLPVHFFSFACAYILYSSYLGHADFPASSLDFFRGWGVDLMFLIAPTKGVHWLWDALGFSLPRSGREQFGDASVWITTFALPVITAGLFAWLKVCKDTKLATGFLLIALFGFYMALGPSIKFYSVKPEGVTTPLMAKEYALAPTGSALLSQFLPGFKSMRASYRWSALGFFGLWLLIVLLLSQKQTGQKWWWLVVFLIISNSPHLERKFAANSNFYNGFFDVENSLVRDLREDLFPGEKIAFLPFRNDFFVNYLASRINVQAYNIGGDKNLTAAKKHWPKTMAQFKMAEIDSLFSERVIMLLARGEADAIILPYIDLLWAAHAWPAPLKYKDTIFSVVNELRQNNFIAVENRKFYSIVRLAKNRNLSEPRLEIEKALSQKYCLPPECLRYTGQLPAPHQTGIYTGAGMQTDGRAGYLIYGPYQPIQAGEYILQVTGEVNSNAHNVVTDVTYHKAGKVYARFEGLITQATPNNNILLEERVFLTEDIPSLEIRVRVAKATDLFIDGYTLKPINVNSLQEPK